ncbi:TrbC/VirB2 family protein (plasmid) [Acinetobacter sp. ESL0695]|uniref:TrbC/VirB2 family protein n=1 Tax=Acinetobacter sp. ESL0695 TaxID=2983215 RepID=UPI0023F4E57C|nr:TrbC/VirB2 family protein [Acinetobacter sp. ESL0695]WEV50245.1 TrbC/VirB2 family protein [Acinetobacter sp. ESL0695]
MIQTLKSQLTMRHVFLALMTLCMVALLFVPDFAHAASTSQSGLPWESPLAKLKDSITGPVAIGISLIAITVSGCMLIFGGEINEFGRRMIMVVLVIAVIVFAAQMLSTLTGKSATLPDNLFSQPDSHSQVIDTKMKTE